MQRFEVDAHERPHAAERLVERDAKAELIRARINGLAVELLGRHVAGRAQQRA
jgi:hypothetical protein